MSPRTSEQNEEIRQKRNKQILDASREVYLEKGFLGTEIGEVAKRAGIARGLVYYYYKDKHALFRKLFEDALSAAIVFIRNLLKTDAPPLERLQQYALYYLHTAFYQPASVQFFQNIWKDIPLVFEEKSDEILASFVENIHQPLVDTMQEAMDEKVIRAGDPLLYAHMFWGGITGAITTITMKNIQPDTEEMNMHIKQSMQLLFYGLLQQ